MSNGHDVIRWEINNLVNKELEKIFDLIDYKTRFTFKVSSHAVERLLERLDDRYKVRLLRKLVHGIVEHGICELLYYQTRYANGEAITYTEFVYEDLIAPFTLVGEYVVIKTMFIKPEEANRSNRRQILLHRTLG